MDSMHDLNELDAFDFKLLAALQADGRLTNAELGEKVGLSASQCSRRRIRLETSGIIAGYRAQLDAERLGFGLTALVQVSLAAHSKENAAQFRAFLGGLDEIQEAYSLTGESDYLLKIVVPTLSDLSRIINDTILPNPIIAHIKSSIILDTLKNTHRIPLEKCRS